MKGFLHATYLGAVVRAPTVKENQNGKPHANLRLAGERTLEGRDARSLPWYITVRLAGRWLEELGALTTGAAVFVTGGFEQFEAEQGGRVTRLIPQRLETVTDYPAAMMLTDRHGGARLPGGHNHTAIIGAVTRIAETRHIRGREVISLGVAVNLTHAADGAPRMVYLTLDAWDALAYTAARLERGSNVAAWGASSLDQWQTAEGEPRTTLNVDAAGLEGLTVKTRSITYRTIPHDPYPNCDLLGSTPTR